jgi:outer membrane protein
MIRKKNIKYKMMKKLFITLIITVCASFGLNAQRTLTLEECINIALENNINIKTARNTAISTKAGYNQSKYEFLPDLRAFAGHSWSEGLDFDQTSGTIVNTTTLGGSGNISTNFVVFNGMNNVYTMAQRKLQYEASLQDIEGNIQITSANVVSSFLDVISSKESLKIANNTLTLLNKQMEQQEKRQSAGIGNLEQVYNFRSQVAQQKLRIVNQENQLKSQKLALIQLLLLDTSVEYEIAGVTANDEELERNIEEYGTVYSKALAYSPALKTSQLTYEASEKGLKISQFAWMPSFTIGASVGTGWSSNVQDPDNPGDQMPISDQFENNVSKRANFNLNIPLFTRMRNQTSVQQSKIRMMNSELNVEQTKNNLTNQVQQAYLAVVNAQTFYVANKESLVNIEATFNFAQTRYDNGTIDFVTYLTSLDGLNQSQLALVQAKYGILLRKLILDIYTGDELNLPDSN